MKKKNNYTYHPEDNTCHILITSKSKHLEIIIDDHSLPGISEHRWSLSNGYAESWIDSKKVLLHRFLIAKEIPKGMQIDHKNGNKLDNRLDNLRIVTQQQNRFNSKPNKNRSSIYKGVYQDNRPNRKKKMYAYISHNGIRYSLGSYYTQKDAAMAYDKEAIKLFGEYANLNFPKDSNIESKL